MARRILGGVVSAVLDGQNAVVRSNLLASGKIRVEFLVVGRILPVPVFLAITNLDCGALILLLMPAVPARERGHIVC